MPVSLIVPSVEAALEVAKFIQSSYELYQAGAMTAEQLQTAWKQAGVSVQSANQAWEASGAAKTNG